MIQTIGVNTASVLLEPVGRNTAPALTLAALAYNLAAQSHVAVSFEEPEYTVTSTLWVCSTMLNPCCLVKARKQL
jgi:mannose-1-phosphate guanylyltransferase (GDP) (EC 2.7.7.22)